MSIYIGIDEGRGAMKTIKLRTSDGDGEATKSASGEPWHVCLPEGDFRFYGSVSEVKREITVRSTLHVEFLSGDA